MIWKMVSAVAVAAACSLLPNSAEASDPDAAIHAPYTSLQLIDGVRVMMPQADYPGFATSNITIIEQQDGLVVVDTGLTRADGARLVDYIRSFTSKPVKAVLFTHWHGDHPQGASEVVAAWPQVRLIATGETSSAIDGPGRGQGQDYKPSPVWEAFVTKQVNDAIANFERQLADPATGEIARARIQHTIAAYRARLPDIPGTMLTAPTETLGERLVIDDPVRPVELLFLGRANTAGDAIAWLPRQRLVVAGDIVVSPIPYGFFSYPADWVETLGKVKALEFEVLVPGHGLPQLDSGYIDRLIASIEDIRARVGPLAAQGLSLDEVRQRVDFTEQTGIFGLSPRRRAALDSLWLQPMIENTWREAKGLPIVQGGAGND